MRAMLALAAIVLPTAASALSPREIIQQNARAVVYLEYKSSSGEVLERGTGFIVSHDGFVVTVAHVKPEEDGQMWATIGQRAGTSFPLTMRETDEKSDVALWQFPQSPTCRAAMTISGTKPRETDKLLALGFPGTSGMTSNALTVTNLITEPGYWKTDGFLEPGNSGGPVLDESGKVVAVVHGGGRPGTENNQIVPIALALPLLQKQGVSAGINDPVPYDESCYASCRDVSHGIERYLESIPWKESSGWFDGGHNPTTECNIVAGAQKIRFHADDVQVTPLEEEERKDILGHVTRRYPCEGVALRGPVYLERQSAACGLWE